MNNVETATQLIKNLLGENTNHEVLNDDGEVIDNLSVDDTEADLENGTIRTTIEGVLFDIKIMEV